MFKHQREILDGEVFKLERNLQEIKDRTKALEIEENKLTIQDKDFEEKTIGSEMFHIQ